MSSNHRRPEKLAMIGAVLALALLGILLAGEFGQSWDEHQNMRFGALYLEAYSSPEVLRSEEAQAYYHGPAYFMSLSVASSVVHSLVNGWAPVDARHFVNYLVFVAGTWAVYRLARRYASPPGAVFAAALFFTQPLFFGHAFMNLKDIPFLTFFTLSVLLGFGMVSALERLDSDPQDPPSSSDSGLVGSLRKDWRRSAPRIRVSIGLLLVTIGAVLIDMTITHLVHAASQELLGIAYQGRGPELLTRFLRRMAADMEHVPLSSYQAKLFAWYSWGRFGVIAAALLGGGILMKRLLPSTARRVFDPTVQAGALVVLAGLGLGVTTAMRTAAPAAGAMVALLALWRLRGRALIPLLVYGLLAALACLATWPALWGDPLATFWSRVVETTTFEEHSVLYLGEVLSSNGLPWHYLPRLLTLKLTLPVLPLALVGIGSAFAAPRLQIERRSELALLGLWFLLPVLVTVFFGQPLYDNFRQLLFITPPLFVFAGVAFGAALSELSSIRMVVAAVGLGMLVPGLVGIAQLHPYPYIYYNALAGGVRGAEGRFELDYWCTSYRAAVEHLNAIAPEGATIAVEGPSPAARVFAREDLKLPDHGPGASGQPDYALACEFAMRDPDYFPGWPVIHRVQVEGVTLAVIKENPAAAERGPTP